MVLNKEAVFAAVERREGCPRPPVFLGDWWGVGLFDRYGEELRHTKGLFSAQKGGLLFAMGSGVMPGTPLANIQAAMEEMHEE